MAQFEINHNLLNSFIIDVQMCIHQKAIWTTSQIDLHKRALFQHINVDDWPEYWQAIKQKTQELGYSMQWIEFDEMHESRINYGDHGGFEFVKIDEQTNQETKQETNQVNI